MNQNTGLEMKFCLVMKGERISQYEIYSPFCPLYRSLIMLSCVLFHVIQYHQINS